MIKKQYIKPTLNVVRFDNRISLMAGSPEGLQMQGDAEDEWEGI